MKKRTDMETEKLPVPMECWVRRGDAIVDVASNRTASDFVAALKNQSVAAWVAVRMIIVNPVLSEKNIKAIICEKKFEIDEIFGIFVERMIFKGKINSLKEPDKIISFMQQCIRNQITRCRTKKEKERGGRLVLIDDVFQNQSTSDTNDEANPVDAIPEDETVVEARSNRLMEDEKTIVRRCFVDFWRKHPRHAYVLNLRNMGLSDKEIRELIGERTDNNVTQLAHRGGKILANLIRGKKIELPGLSSVTLVRKREYKHA